MDVLGSVRCMRAVMLLVFVGGIVIGWVANTLTRAVINKGGSNDTISITDEHGTMVESAILVRRMYAHYRPDLTP